MIISVEGKQLKRGDSGWVVGVEAQTGIYRPSHHRVHIDHTIPNIYASYDECKKECDSKNTKANNN